MLHPINVESVAWTAERNAGGKADEAAAHFHAALAIRSEGLVANLNLGAYEDRRGNVPVSVESSNIFNR